MATIETPTHASLLAALASVEAGPRAFRACLDTVRGFLEGTSVGSLLAAVGGAEATRSVEQFMGHVEHVGLMAPPGMPLEAVTEAATASGFVLRPASFASVLVARELGSIAGAEAVPTTIFRASAQATPSRSVGVEIFLPTADEATIRSWIRAGVSSHVAIELQRPDSEIFSEITEQLERAGFVVPSFFRERPLLIPYGGSLDLRTLYFDRHHGDKRSRIEVLALGDLPQRMDAAG